jgi:ankyrin repeat protein
MLLDANAEVNLNSRDTVLHMACKKLCPETVRLLLEAGADANGTFDFDPILHCLIMRKCEDGQVAAKIEILELLLDAGAALEQPEPKFTSGVIDIPNHCLSAMHECAAAKDGCERVATARALLRHDRSHLQTLAHYGTSPLELAMQHKHVDIVRLFIDEMPISKQQNNRNIPWFKFTFSIFKMDATMQSRIREVLRLVLGAGVDVMGVDKHGCTALMMAVDSEHTKFGDTAAKAYISDIIDHIRGVELI